MLRAARAARRFSCMTRRCWATGEGAANVPGRPPGGPKATGRVIVAAECPVFVVGCAQPDVPREPQRRTLDSTKPVSQVVNGVVMSRCRGVAHRYRTAVPGSLLRRPADRRRRRSSRAALPSRCALASSIPAPDRRTECALPPGLRLTTMRRRPRGCCAPSTPLRCSLASRRRRAAVGASAPSSRRALGSARSGVAPRPTRSLHSCRVGSDSRVVHGMQRVRSSNPLSSTTRGRG